MSEHDHAATPSVAHQVKAVVLLAAVPLALVAAMVGGYKAVDRGSEPAMSDEAVAARLQKVGSVSLGSASHEPRSGEAVFKAQCTTCHSAGLLGAPKFGDAAAWGARIATGYDKLLVSALKGKGNMTPQGGGAFSDDEVGRALVYMANAAGAKFTEPAAPAAAK